MECEVGVLLDGKCHGRLYRRKGRKSEDEDIVAAVVLHPYGKLGGSIDDVVTCTVGEGLCKALSATVCVPSIPSCKVFGWSRSKAANEEHGLWARRKSSGRKK